MGGNYAFVLNGPYFCNPNNSRWSIGFIIQTVHECPPPLPHFETLTGDLEAETRNFELKLENSNLELHKFFRNFP